MSQYIIANWKANKDYHQTSLWVKGFKQQLKFRKAEQKLTSSQLQIVVAPSYPLLWPLSNALHREKLQLKLATQDFSHQPAGSFTGSVPGINLQGLAISFAIVGHSERRRFFGETDKMVAAKVKLALKAGITPIICIDQDYLESQANLIGKQFSSQCLVAYEPWTAISTATNNAQSATLKTIKPVVAKIKTIYQPKAVIYGGSVNENNVNQYLKITDGCLVGGACLSGKQFADMVANAQI